ncbi:MAG: hypothetical protein WKF76_11125 [Nocardioidaceae bacterium]
MPASAAGQKVVVAERVKSKAGMWLGVWYLGDIGWLYSPKTDPVAVAAPAVATVSAKPGAASVPVYGRAYPEEAAYAGTAVPYQTVVPLQYTIKAGQAYSLADATIDTNYYYAKTYDDVPARRPHGRHRAGQVLRDLVRSPDVLRPGRRRGGQPVGNCT